MNKNHWETQPRKKNGEFTFRLNYALLSEIEKILKVVCERNPDSVSDVSGGGKYGDLRKITAGNKNFEIHHMPADSVSPLSYWAGPCVIMDKDDHALTVTYKNSTGAKEFREQQKELIKKGCFLEAEYMDIKDLLCKFGSKYAKAMSEKLQYDKALDKGHVME